MKALAARDTILSAIETALRRQTRNAGPIDTQARALLEDPNAARPALPLPSIVESFAERVAGPKVGATVNRIGALAELPGAVAHYLAATGRKAEVTVQPTGMLTGLDWTGAGIHLASAVDDAVVVGLALWGIAETGSVVFHSARDMPILHNFLGAVHIVAVRAACIVPYLEDYAIAARNSGDPAPRNVCLITGASGTTDIEGSLVRGAHGPSELHVIVIDEHG